MRRTRRKTKAASKSQVQKEVCCSLCHKPIPFGELRKHHKVPRCTLSILGFRINAEWNLEPRHASCEIPAKHEICELAKGFTNRHMWPEGFIERVVGRIRMALSDFSLEDQPVMNARDFFGKDPHGLIPLISSVPKDYQKWIPDLINPILLEELLAIAPEKVVKRVMKQLPEQSPRAITLPAEKVLIPEVTGTRFGAPRTSDDRQLAASVQTTGRSRFFIPA